jgi:hypothetical protein
MTKNSVKYFRGYSLCFAPELPYCCINTVKIWIDKHILLGFGANFEYLYDIGEITKYHMYASLKHKIVEDVSQNYTQFRIGLIPLRKNLRDLGKELDFLIYELNLPNHRIIVNSFIYCHGMRLDHLEERITYNL